MSFRLVDEDGTAFEPEPRSGRYGVDLAGWAEFEGVPEHVWWNLRHPPPEDDERRPEGPATTIASVAVLRERGPEPNGSSVRLRRDVQPFFTRSRIHRVKCNDESTRRARV